MKTLEQIHQQQQKQRRYDGWFSDKNNRNNNDISSLDVNLGTQISATDHVQFAYTAWRKIDLIHGGSGRQHHPGINIDG
ncbi:hypothetical protein DPMN_099062 [Dreissena polymorpha]|uniref:Uncharacterized protein n=1 Tax=Dreissena polymorpha TaxID=45954 RepID=A0A9D4LEX1_DREPO|nr:hypothetical protein DPMN_099062 [Dreissena polymorpha]